MRNTIQWLWTTAKDHRLQITLNALLGLFSVGISLLTVSVMHQAIDIAAGARQGSLILMVSLMGALILTEFAISITKVWIRNILGVKAQNTMQQHMLSHLLRAEWQGRERYHSGDIINRLEQDVQTVVTFLTETLPNTLSVLTMFIGAFLYLFMMDRMLALITVAILPIFILLSKIYVGKMRALTHRVRESDSQIQSLLQETLQHRMLIKTLESDKLMIHRLDRCQQTLRGHVRHRTRFSIFSNFVLNGGFALSYLIAFLWSTLRLYHHTLTFGAMTAFLQLVYRIQNPARELTRLAPAFVGVLTAAERLMLLETIPEEVQGISHPLQPPCGIRLTHLTYTYPPTASSEPTTPVISDLTFHFAPGTSTAIMGATGTGKSTLLRLLLALLKPDSGSVTLYDATGSYEASPLLRCNIVYVPQGNTLMSGTIRDNLLLARPEATDAELREVLLTACAEFVFDLPRQMDTPTTEGGGGLSEGQAQRIAIARALLRSGSIMLFDEATSALDPATEQRLLQNILANNKRTVIFITHRHAVVDYCDAVLTL